MLRQISENSSQEWTQSLQMVLQHADLARDQGDDARAMALIEAAYTIIDFGYGYQPAERDD